MAGVILIGTGFYFLLLRPPLLPEDIRYIALPPAQFDILRPRLELWLTHVFRVMGGYVLATGVLMVTLAVTSFRQHSTPAAIGALIGGVASIGWMAVVNFLINSDFKWVLLAMALLWAVSLVLFWVEKPGRVDGSLATAEALMLDVGNHNSIDALLPPEMAERAEQIGVQKTRLNTPELDCPRRTRRRFRRLRFNVFGCRYGRC